MFSENKKTKMGKGLISQEYNSKISSFNLNVWEMTTKVIGASLPVHAFLLNHIQH